MNVQDWFPLGLIHLISFQSKGLWRVFSNTTVQKHQFFGTQLSFFLFFFLFLKIYLIGGYYFTILYWFCHTSTWICHRCTCVPHPEPLSHLPPHPIPQGHPSAPAMRTLSHVSNPDWQSISHMEIYMFLCYSLKPSHTRLLPQRPKIYFLYLCLFCCLMYRVIIIVFLNCIYMH